MDEENKTNSAPKVKKGGKAKKIILIVVLILAIIAIVVGILFATGILDVNLSKPSKMVAGVEKIGETITTAVDNLNPDGEDNSVKIFNSLSSNSAVEVSGELSANIEKFDSDSYTSTVRTSIKEILDIINDSKVGIDVKYDGKEKIAASINGSIDNVNLSGEAIYDGKKLAVRSEEINEDWISFDKSLIEDAIEDEIDEEQIEAAKKMITELMKQLEEFAKTIEIDEKTQQEIEDRYSDVLKDYINDKSKNIKTEKTKITVDGKEKSCEKLTLKLDDKAARDLLIKYIDTFKSDKQLQNILKKTINAYADMCIDVAETMGESTREFEQMQNLLDELLEQLDEAKDAVKELEFDGNLLLTVYGTSTNTYRTDIALDIEGTTVTLETTFNEDKTVMEINVESSGVSLDVARITITSDKNNVSLKAETLSGLEKQLGTSLSAEMSIKNEGNKSEISLSADLGEHGGLAVTVISNTLKNENTAYEVETTVKFDIDMDSEFVTKGNIKLKTGIKTSGISIPTVKDSECIDGTEEKELQKYLKDSQENILDLLEKLTKIDSLKSIIPDTVKDKIENIELYTGETQEDTSDSSDTNTPASLETPDNTTPSPTDEEPAA